MKVEVEKLPDCKQRLKIEVPQEEVDRQLEAIYRELGKKSRVDGFRPGKVPLSILRRHFREVAIAEATKKIVARAYSEAVKEKGILPLNDPEVEIGDAIPEEKKPFSFQVTVETWPEVKVEGYKGLSLERERIEISNEEIETVLKMKQEENAHFLPVENRPVKEDDWVMVDFKISLDENPFQSAEGHLFRLGLGVFPREVEEKLIGKLPDSGEELEVEVGLPGEKSSTKTLYRVKLRGIKERRLLTVDDEFARDLGDFASLAELREDIRKKLENGVREEEKGKLRDEIVNILVKENEVEAPPRLIEEQFNYLMSISRTGLIGAAAGEKEESKLREKLRPLAIKQVKSSLILEEIARRENIVVSEEEIKKEAAGSQAPLTKERREDFAHRIKRKNTLDFLINQAEVQEKEKSLVLTPDQVRMLMPREKKFREPGGGRIIVP